MSFFLKDAGNNPDRLMTSCSEKFKVQGSGYAHQKLFIIYGWGKDP
jgi:hypothetical protein